MAMIDRPAVSVVVPAYNVAWCIRRALDGVLAQSFRDFELIISDNGSTDGSVEMVGSEYPECKVVALEENQGIAGRNAGIRATDAKYVFCLDNDITFLTPDGTRRAVERMEQDESIAALSMLIAEEPNLEEFTHSHWWHPRPREEWQDKEFETSHFNEAAVMLRASCLERVGLYPAELFWACEEWDLALRIMDSGDKILYFPDTKVLHEEARGIINTQANARHHLITRNRFWIVLKYYPTLMALKYIVPRAVLWFGRSIIYRYFGYYSKGLFEFLRLVPSIMRTRKVISAQTVQRLKEIEGGWQK